MPTSSTTRRSRGPSGGAGNAETYVTNKQFSSGLTYTPSGTSLLEARFGWSTRGRARTRRRWSTAQPPRKSPTASPACRPIRASPAGLPTQLITGYLGSRPPGDQPAVAVPDGVQPEGQLHLAAGPSLAQDRLRIPARADRSAGRQPALRPRFLRRPVLAAGVDRGQQQPLQPRRLHVRRCARPTRSATSWSPSCEQNMHFMYLQDDWRVNDRLTLNAGLRYEYATPWTEANNVLSNFDPATKTMVIAKDGSLEDRSTLKPDRNNFGPRLGIAYTPTRSHRDPRRLRHQLRALPSRRRRQRAADQRPAGDQRRRRADARRRHVPHDAAGLSGGPDRSDALQSAARQHHLHAGGLPLERRAQLVRVGAARNLGRRAARPRLRRQSRQRHAAVRQLQPGGAEQRRRHAVAAVAAADPGVRATSPIRSTAASRATTRSRPSSTGASAAT